MNANEVLAMATSNGEDQLVDGLLAVDNGVGQPAASALDEPFYVVDLGDVCRKVKLWRLKLPRVTPFYAVKCNPLPEVLRTLAHFGLGFDCASKAEIDTVLAETGVEPGARIIYANPCKTRSFIRHARSRGVRRMTFDNADELDKIAELYPDAELVIRIKVDDSGSLMKFSSKFGADLDIVPDLLDHAAFLGLNVVGVSFHVGSGCANPDCFAEAIANARWVFDQAALVGFEMTLLDLGGGFPGNAGCETLFADCARVINVQLEESFPSESVQVIAEPGRFMVASAFNLYTTVIAKRRETDNNHFMYYLNDGVYGSFNCKVFDHNDPEPIVVARAAPLAEQDNERCDEEEDQVDGKEPIYTSVLWGPTCDSLDKVHDGVLLPELFIGDWLAFRDMGAYTCSAASNFNGFAKPTFHFVLSAATEIILAGSDIGRQLLVQLHQQTEQLQELQQRISDKMGGNAGGDQRPRHQHHNRASTPKAAMTLEADAAAATAAAGDTTSSDDSALGSGAEGNISSTTDISSDDDEALR